MRMIVIVLTVFLASSCSLARSQDRDVDPGYDPIPDANLFARAAEVDGIQKADLRYVSTLGDDGYRGELTVRADLTRAEAGKAVATVYAILRQGRPDTTMSFEVSYGDNPVTDDLPGVPIGDLPGLEEEFGPQPGDGTPPPR